MACAKCEGTGWRAVERDGVRRVERCECWQDTRTAKLLGDARIPPRYARCDLENFVLYPNEQLIAAVTRATVRRRVSRGAEGALPHRPAWDRQDAHRRRRPPQGRRRERRAGPVLRR